MDEVGVGSILDYAVEEDLEKSDAVEMEMDSCSSGTGSSTVIFISVCIIEKIWFSGFFERIFRPDFRLIFSKGLFQNSNFGHQIENLEKDIPESQAPDLAKVIQICKKLVFQV